jgi:hypothetical protein
MDGGIPGMDGGIPGMDDGMPGMDDGIPGMDDGIPGMDDGMPGTDDGIPGMDDGIPGVDGIPGGGGPVWGSLPEWLELLLAWLSELAAAADGTEPVGDPFQVSNVRFAGTAYQLGQEFTVTWDVSGDESEVSGFRVELFHGKPDQNGTIIGPDPVATTVVVPTGAGQYEVTLATLVPGTPDPFIYLVPRVTALPVGEDAPRPMGEIGFARPLLPEGASDMLTPPLRLRHAGAGGIDEADISPTDEPPPTGRAMWMFGQGMDQRGTRIEHAPPYGLNLAVRPDADDETLTFWFVTPEAVSGKYKVVAHAGFLGISDEGANHMQVEMTALVAPRDREALPSETPPIQLLPPAPATAEVDETNESVPISIDLDTTGHYGGAPCLVSVILSIKGFTGDPKAAPPALFGVRLIRQ